MGAGCFGFQPEQSLGQYQLREVQSASATFTLHSSRRLLNRIKYLDSILPSQTITPGSFVLAFSGEDVSQSGVC